MNDVVALLLDDSMPARRLGELLHAARKRRGWKRRDAAARAGVRPSLLKAYEQGVLAVPPEVCARLAEAYGEDLTAHVPLRVPPQIDDGWLVVGDDTRAVDGSAADVLANYVQLVARLRHSRPGEPLALRSTDVVALAVALSAPAEEIESQIMSLLACSRDEARALHSELLRRKVLLPVAGLAASVVALAGFTAAHAESGNAGTLHHTPPTTVTTTAPAPPAPPTTVTAPTPPSTAAPTRHVSSDDSSSTPTTQSHDSDESPTTDDTPPSPPQSLTDATVPPDQQAADVPTTDDTPVSIPPGEHVVIIGTPESTSEASPPAGA